MRWLDKIHFLHRAWRYRLRTEKFGVSFLLSRDLAGRTAVDIGANRGIYSYWMSGRVGSNGRVIAFEPQPELASQLRELRMDFGLTNLEIVEAGLSDTDARLVLKRPRNHWGGASLEPGTHADETTACDDIPIDVTTLDGFFRNHASRPIAFIKCDVEGHEGRVFQGARTILSVDRPDLLFECHRAGEPDCEVFALLTTLDYEGFCFFGGGLAPIADYRSLRPRMHPKSLTDVVFLPRERTDGRRREADHPGNPASAAPQTLGDGRR